MTARPSLTLVLASSSPRRRDLLAQIGVTPGQIRSPDIDEEPRKGEVPRPYAERMASEKALAVPREEGEVVLAGDTTVALGRRILPQAQSEEDVAGFLRMLSGRRHRVHSAISVIDASGRQRTRCVTSQVRFKRLSEEEIRDYARSGDGIGKAGGYAIQGRAAGLIDFLAGSHSAVVGLPLFETRTLLKAAGIALA